MVRMLAMLLILALGAQAQEVTFTYKFKKGETVRSKETMTQSMTSDAMGSQSVKSTRYTKMVVNDVAANGTVEVVRSTDSSSMTLNDKPFTNPQAQMSEKVAFKLKLDATGKVIEASPVEPPTDAVGKQMVDAMAAQFKNNPGFPAKKVKAGDTWSDEMTNNQPTPSGTLTTMIKLTTTLDKFEKQNGVDVALMSIKGTISGELGAGMGTITGTVAGTRVFAYKLGQEVRSSMEMDQTMDITSPQGNMTMQTKMKQDRERLK